MLVDNRGLGSAGSAVGVAVGSQIATAGALVSGTIIGLPAGAVMMAVGGLVALGSTIAGALHIGEGCGPTCVEATSIVNQAEPILRDNVSVYKSGGFDSTQAVSNFNQVWQTVVSSCGAIPGQAGKDCVGDRQRGACKWKDADGSCWDWFKGYYDPLLVPNGVQANSGSGGSGVLSNLNLSGGSPLLLVGAAVLVVMALGRD